jgi:hypothetical protein
MKKIMKKTEEPEVFKNYFESYPVSENWIFNEVSFYNESKGMPMLVMN